MISLFNRRSSDHRRCVVSCLSKLGLVACLLVFTSIKAYSQDVDSLPGLTTLLAQLQETEQTLIRLEGRIPPTESKVRALIRQVAAIEEKKERQEEKPPKKEGVKKVAFRLPRMQQKKLDTPALIICENNRVTVFDIDAAGKTIESRFSGSPISGTVTPAPGHITGNYSVGFAGLGMTLSRIDGHPGETVQEVSGANSEYQQFVSRLNSNTDVIQFFVFPDSYDAFRQARQVVWGKAFNVRWIPLGSGDPLKIGGGGGGVSVD